MKTIAYRNYLFGGGIRCGCRYCTGAVTKVPLKTQLPRPLFGGTPVPLNVPNLEPPLKGKRPDFKWFPRVPSNLAQREESYIERQQSCGGNVGPRNRWRQGRRRRPGMGGARAGQTVGADRFGKRRQHLCPTSPVWHFHSQARCAYRDVVVQISNDPTFEVRRDHYLQQRLQRRTWSRREVRT